MMEQARTWDAGIYNEGNGTYQRDYDRLVYLIPKRGRSDTVSVIANMITQTSSASKSPTLLLFCSLGSR